MCGIVGSLRWSSEESLEIVQKMTAALAHRGPDADKVVRLNPLILGHRRLSIIETSPLSNQPMVDYSKRYWIAYNGELYNFKELKKELKALSHSFYTESDTEVILEAYKEWGVECLQHFVGMFAFALWDNLEKRLFIARDRLGEKPLYYSLLKTQQHIHPDIIFASELTALRWHPHVSNEIDPNALSDFLSLNYILTNHCILQSVSKLPPAHYLIIEQHKPLVIKPYWDLSHYFKHKTVWKNEKEAAYKLQELIESTVSNQCISDVPLGAFLSGGLDSSTIVASMNKTGHSKTTKTFSTGFYEKSYNELDKSTTVAKWLGVDHHTQWIDVDLAKSLSIILKGQDEPFADTSLIPMYFLAQFARKGVKVCLSGDGGDELFAGYETYAANYLHRIFNKFPKSLIKNLIKGVDVCLPVSFNKVSFDYKLKQFLKGCLNDFEEAHYSWRTVFNENEKTSLLLPERREVVDFNPFIEFDGFFKDVRDCHPLDQASYVDIKTWLVDDILVKVDRYTMMHSLESRAPFLDHRIVEFAASLPPQWKMNYLKKKYILKKSQKNNLPKKIIHQAKKGFNAPISEWFTKDLQPLGLEITLDPIMKEWFSLPAIEKYWQEHKKGTKDHGLKLFGLTCLGFWLKENQSKRGSL